LTENGIHVGVVGVPGGWSSEVLADAFAERTGRRLLIDMSKVVCDVSSGEVLYDGVDLCALDALAIKKPGSPYGRDLLHRLEILEYVATRGVSVFSQPRSIQQLVDRLGCTMILRTHGTPMPRTTVTEDVGQALAAIANYGSVVLKPLYSTKARGMRILRAGRPEKLIEELGNHQTEFGRVLYIQEMVDIPGRDLGVAFMGGRYLGTYARVSGSTSWNTTIHEGGHYESYEPSSEIIELAYRAQKPFGLDFTTVDVVETPESALVFEVSAFGGFRGLRDGLGLNAASLFADYVIEKVKHEVVA
jgi:ribosomal protein S6--L-glutamate ligase